MHPRLRIVLIGLVACAAAAIAGVSLADRGDSARPAPAGDGFRGALRPKGVPPKDFALRDQDGRVARLADYRGKVVVLTFLYSTCEDTCPILADQVRGALDDLGSTAPPALAISVDPAGDTPDRARAFLLERRLAGRMRYLLGTKDQLEPVWRGYAVQPQSEDFEHSAYVLLIDKAGRQRIGFPVNRLTPEGLAHDIRLLARES
ncbi:MAG: SCO family protein [Actinomycetota bacterium]|nr:SCO family protein [Actinomycetota bacterium]